MKLSPDDPRLTAYLLEELDPAEQAAVDEALRHDPERYREVLELGRTAMALSETLRQVPVGLTEAQEADVEQALVDSDGDAEPASFDDPPANVVPLPRIARVWGSILGGIAAALVAAWILWPEMPNGTRVPGKSDPSSRASQTATEGPGQAHVPAHPDPSQPGHTDVSPVLGKNAPLPAVSQSVPQPPRASHFLGVRPAEGTLDCFCYDRPAPHVSDLVSVSLEIAHLSWSPAQDARFQFSVGYTQSDPVMIGAPSEPFRQPGS